jgi:hypothetical protein
MPDTKSAKSSPGDEQGKKQSEKPKKVKERKAAKPKDVLTDPVRNDGSGDMAHYLDEAKRILPKEKDEWKLNELATMLLDQSKLVRKYWDQMNAIANRSDEKTLVFSMAFSSVRKISPPEVQAKVSFSESWKDSLKSKVPDPKQKTLPLEDRAADPNRVEE